MTKSEILKAKPSGGMTMREVWNDDTESYTWYIQFQNGVEFSFKTTSALDSTYRLLKRMGFYDFATTMTVESQDEFDGLVQAAQLGQNPYRCTIMCSNPKLNSVG